MRFLSALLVALAVFTAGAVPVSAATPQRGHVYENATVSGYKWIDSAKGDCTGCVFRSLTVKPSRYGFHLYNGVTDVLIDGVTATLQAPTKGGDLPAAVAVVSRGGAPDRITIRNSAFSGFKMVPVPGHYTNGDGVDCDSRPTHLFLSNIYSHDNSDGGIDTKCITVADNLRSEGNYRNYRVWGQFTGTTLTSANPRNAHLWVSKGADVVIDLLDASGSTGAAVIYSDAAGGHPVIVKACRFAFDKPTPLLKGAKNPAIQLGPTCQADAKGYAINTPPEPPKPPAIVPDFVSAEDLKDTNGDGRVVLSSATAKRLKLPAGTVLKPLGQVEGGFGYMIVK